jgi:membrane-bound lytic murein transglycosylase D
MNISVEELRQLNPQYRRDIIPARPEKPYILKLPNAAISAFIDNENQIFAYNRDKYFPNNMLVPLKGRYRGSKGSGEGMREVTHLVKSGENLGTVAAKYRVSVAELRDWNDISRKRNIRAGQRLTVYVPGKPLKGKVAVLEGPKTEQQTLANHSTDVPIVKAEKANAAKTNETASTDEYILYTVQSGDSLFTIAKKFPGITDADLMSFNNIRNARGLVIGQQLKIPKKT